MDIHRYECPAEWKFTTRVSAGINIEHGNIEKQTFHGDLNLGLSKYPHRITFYGELNREKTGDPSVSTENNSLVNLDYNRFVSKKWYLFGKGQAQQDEFEDLDLLWFVAAGAGYQFWKSKTKNFTLNIGPSYVSEHYSKPMVNMETRTTENMPPGSGPLTLTCGFLSGFCRSSTIIPVS